MEVWIGRDGERHGPYQESDIRAWLRSGQVSPQDLGWYEGLADWQPLASLFPEVTAQQAAGGTTPPAFAAAAPLPLTNAASLEDYAGFWKRVAAYILDGIVLWIPNTLIASLLGAAAADQAYKQALLAASNNPDLVRQAMLAYFNALGPAILAQAVLVWLYFAVLESSPLQATLGKLALGIRVTDERGARISFLRATGRFFAKWLSAVILCIGFMMAGWTRRKQALHDMLAGTLVLNGRASEFKNAASPTRNPGRGPDGSFNA